ncbi:uncharacterized protein [Trachinotus anak]|uniref:uncharacterized protein n=1 Tax=Trachinotus anak TaxID=443729 RepID=UPI0039F1E040
MRETSLYCLLGHLIIVSVASSCVSVHCLRCNISQNEDYCKFCLKPICVNDTLHANKPSSCKKDFRVYINSTGSNAKEGDTITLTCGHNVPNLNLTLGWKKDGKEIHENKNMSSIVLDKVLSPSAGQYICYVNSSCGNYESVPHIVTVENNNAVLLVICGVAALVLVLILGLAMKFKLKRDNAKHKARMAQRALDGRTGGPAPFTPRES